MQQSNENTILLIDGNSIINRSYFALAGRSALSAPDGTPTGAINTYLNTVWRHIQDIQPTHILTLFDRREKTFRHEKYDGYKAKRKPMPDDLAVQMPVLKEVLDAMRIPRYEMIGFEADDLIGTYAARARDEGYKVYILSGDKDDFQLIDDQISIIMPMSGKTDAIIYDRQVFTEKYGIDPEDFITLKALMGDNSDNIPGVPGIGEKTALPMVAQYRTLDEIYANIDNFSKSIQKKLVENKSLAYLSYDLSEIRQDVPVNISIDDLRRNQSNEKELASIFYKLGLRSQIKKFKLESFLDQITAQSNQGSSDNTLEHVIKISEIPEEIRRADTDQLRVIIEENIKKIDGEHYIVLDVLAQQSSEIFLIVRVSAQEVFAVPDNHVTSVCTMLKELGFGQKKRKIVGYDIKSTFKPLPQPALFDTYFDIQIAGYLLNQIEGASPRLETLFEHALNQPCPRYVPLYGQASSNKQIDLLSMNMDDSVQSTDNESKEEMIRQHAFNTSLIWHIASVQEQLFKKENMTELAFDIEMPLISCLDKMERKGVGVDKEYLDDLHHQFEIQLQSLSEEIYEHAGTPFNILSPKQLGEVLFEKLNLPSGRKSAGGQYSTDIEELNRLRDRHPIVSLIIEYRQISKLDSTFVVGLQKEINASDGRIHTTFSQAMTTTGRLSSSDPNLQNIPIRSEAGSRIRKAFVASKGYKLVAADYSQIELRLLAHLSQDIKMLEAFANEEDIHTNTATSIFHVEKEDVLPYMRAAAKTVNFSIIYGISDYGLAQDLGVSYSEAHQYIAHYYETYPQIKAYLNNLVEKGHRDGFVKTMFGRKRILRELKSPNRNLRMFGERAAMNTPIQGSAADIIKIAMRRVEQALKQHVPQAALILQIHDELIIECPEACADKVSNILKNEMESAVMLSVPLSVDVCIGRSWFECKG